jgi:hypothetical protein
VIYRYGLPGDEPAGEHIDIERLPVLATQPVTERPDRK